MYIIFKQSARTLRKPESELSELLLLYAVQMPRAVDSLLFTAVHSVIGLEDRTGRQAHRAAVRAVIQPNRAENKIASV